MIVSYYKDTFDKASSVTVHVNSILKNIGSGKWEQNIIHLQTLEKAQYDEAKKLLPCVTFGGTFSYQNSESLIEHSGLIVIDIDKLTDDYIKMFKGSVTNDPLIYTCFVSPSGKGLKVLVKIEANQANHIKNFVYLHNHFKQTYGVTIDASGKDVCRLCYVSYDPDIYTNANSITLELPPDFEFSQKTNHDRPPEKFGGKSITKDVNEVYKVCVKWAERKYKFESGQRNNYLYALACGLNRCGVTQGDAFQVINAYYIGIEKKEISQIVRNAYFHNKEDFGSITVYKLEETEQPDFDKIIASFESDLTYEDCIINLSTSMFKSGLESKFIKMTVPATIRQVFADLEDDLDLSVEYIRSCMNIAWKKFKDEVTGDSFEIETMSDMGAAVLAHLTTNMGVCFNLPCIDNIFGGALIRGNNYAIIGTGGTLKSILAECAAADNCKRGIPVLYLNGEMSRVQFYDRMIAKELGIDLAEIRAMDNYEEVVNKYSKQVDEILKGNLFVANMNPFSEKGILSTLEMIRIKYKKEVEMLIIDGIGQMAMTEKDDIKSLITNSKRCKEIAKVSNEGRGVVSIFLSHTSSNISQHIRDTSKFTRGGAQILTALDGYLCTSLCIDPITKDLNNDEIVYLKDKLFLKAYDKRGSGDEINKIIQVDRPLRLSEIHIDPNQFEVDI